jgi:hypothetical protein
VKISTCGWSRTPREYQKSLYLITYLQKKTIELLESAKTESAQLEAVNRLVDIDREKRQLLSDGPVIEASIKALQKQRKQEILESTKAAEALKKRLLDEEVERRLAAALKKHSPKQKEEQSQNNEQAKE